MPITLGFETAEEEFRGNTRGILEKVAKIINEPRLLHEDNHVVVMSRFYYGSIQVAGDAKRPDQESYRAPFTKALGQKEADELLATLDTAFKDLEQRLKTDKRALLQLTEPDKRRVLASLHRLKEATAGYGGFFLPITGTLHPRVNTHRCTGG